VENRSGHDVLHAHHFYDRTILGAGRADHWRRTLKYAVSQTMLHINRGLKGQGKVTIWHP
jgi:hypothetical protein